MKEIVNKLNKDISLLSMIGSARQRTKLAKIVAFGFVLFCLIPLIVGLILPYYGGAQTDPNQDIVMRVPTLLATGGVSFLMAVLGFFLLMKFPRLQRVYVFLMLPVCLSAILMQVIMYKEFGIEINYRVLGLFRENFAVLWSIASKDYYMNWLVALTLLTSWHSTKWVFSTRANAFAMNRKLHITVASLLVCSGALASGLRQNVDRLDFYHPSKASRAPLFQVMMLGKTLLVGYQTGYKEILKRHSEFSGTVSEEVTARLGAEPEEFVKRTVKTPGWVKKKPSHVFMFLLESIEHRLISDPECSPLVPNISRYVREGVSVPYFVSAGHCTIEAVHSICSGSAAIHHYPANEYPLPRTLSLYDLDTLPKVMERSHYRPLFLSASFRKFRSKGDVCEAYGYEKFIGCPDVATDIRASDWGVSDGDFFEWTKNITAKLDSPHFITFLNVSNHAPFDAPVENISNSEIFTPAVADRFYGLSQKEKLKYAKHIYYADLQVGKAVDYLKQRYPDALFVFVGDHNGRKLKGYMRGRVPFVLWNDRVIDSTVDTSRWYGTHMDVLATLANVVLPQGEKYRTLGRPVWSARKSRVSLGHNRILCQWGIFEKERAREVAFSPQDTGTNDDAEVWDWSRCQSKASAVEAISWGKMHSVAIPEE